MTEAVMQSRPEAAPQAEPTLGAGLEDRLELGAIVARRLSHDFGNVLTGVLGFTELALANGSPGTRSHAYVQEVWDAARTGAEWLKQLHLFCRRNAVEFTPTGLPGALAEEQARLEPGQGPGWHADIPPDLPAIACDSESLRQALRQVLDNAREATGGREPAHIVARAVDLVADAPDVLGHPPAGKYVEITVVDRGPGISDDARARLFREWFYSSKPRHRGMGLMVTYGILRRIGGGLAIGSALAGGTQVRMLFPAAPEPIPAGPAHILIVDEDPQVLAEARRILEPAAYSLQVATSAPEAMALYHTAATRFDLVVIASQLPNLTGPELAHRLLLRAPQAKFLFLHTPSVSALPRDELLTADTLVHKPLAAPVLLQAVAAALRRTPSAAGD
jgi:CheY-like chemotaxis protein